MKNITILAVCALIGGCVYTVPLVKTPKIEIGSAVVGLWELQENKESPERMLVLPLSKKECLVSYSDKETLYFRACLAKVADKTIVQLQVIGGGGGGVPDDNRIYQYAEYKVEGDTLTVRMLNDEVIDRDIDSTRALTKAIKKHIDDPNLFKDAGVFKRVKE